MDTSFLELRCKEVVNVVDGRKLGHVIDVVFNLSSGCVQGIVVPGERSFWSFFKSVTDLFISLSQIVKVGEDAILVELYTTNQNSYILAQPKQKK